MDRDRIFRGLRDFLNANRLEYNWTSIERMIDGASRAKIRDATMQILTQLWNSTDADTPLPCDNKEEADLFERFHPKVPSLQSMVIRQWRSQCATNEALMIQFKRLLPDRLIIDPNSIPSELAPLYCLIFGGLLRAHWLTLYRQRNGFLPFSPMEMAGYWDTFIGAHQGTYVALRGEDERDFWTRQEDEFVTPFSTHTRRRPTVKKSLATTSRRTNAQKRKGVKKAGRRGKATR